MTEGGGTGHGGTGGCGYPLRRAGGDAGSSTVLGLALMLVLLAVGGVIGTIGVVSVTRHRAEATADLAALAAARHVFEGEQAACGAARRLAAEQGARLLDCRLEALDVVVVVGVRPPGRVASFGLVRGQARAGRR